MPIVVQKFGGTSVADAEKIRAAAGRALKSHKEGNQVVVVASARGKQTDQLVADALELNPNPSKREMDMLLSTGEQQTVSLMGNGSGCHGAAGHQLYRPAGSDDHRRRTRQGTHPEYRCRPYS